MAVSLRFFRAGSIRKPTRKPKGEPTMTLQAKLDAFKADFEAGKPPYSVPRSAIETMHRATAELIASGAAQRQESRRRGSVLLADGSRRENRQLG
jgi:hypothetical protein